MRTETKVIEKKSPSLKEKYYRIAHKSGLDIYVFPKKMSTSYALFGTKYGAIDNCFRLAGEEEYTRVPDGIAHFLEHKMFEAEDGSDTNERFVRLGASANAFTSSDMTAYEFSCTENVYDALGVLLDYVTHPYFTEENVEKEQGIIGQEICGCDDRPNRRLYYDLLGILYEKDSIRINVCGTIDSIAQITPAHLYRCYHTFYRLSNMALVLAGDVDYSKVIEVADAFLKQEEEVEIERYFEAEPKKPYKTRSVTEMAVGMPLFAVGFKDPSPVCEGEGALRRSLIMRLLSDLLFGTSTVFYDDMYRRGLFNRSFSCGYEASRRTAFFLLMGETGDPEEVMRCVLSMLEEKKKNPPAREDFERIRRSVYAEHIRTFDSTEGIAYEFLSDLFAGVDMLEVGAVLSSITYEECLETLATFFEEGQSAMAVIRPIGAEKEE